MNRAPLRQLAEDRLRDAQLLLTGGRWAGAYYLTGYAVECGLKACIMVHVEASGAIFQDRRFSEKCWTHGLQNLLELANLTPKLVADTAVTTALGANWIMAKDWTETTRYLQKTHLEARSMFDAVANQPNGVLSWIRIHW